MKITPVLVHVSLVCAIFYQNFFTAEAPRSPRKDCKAFDLLCGLSELDGEIPFWFRLIPVR